MNSVKKMHKTHAAQPMHNPCTTYTQPARGAHRVGAALLTLLALSACSPGGVVAGTIGAAGAVAGTAVDVVLRADTDQGGFE